MTSKRFEALKDYTGWGSDKYSEIPSDLNSESTSSQRLKLAIRAILFTFALAMVFLSSDNYGFSSKAKSLSTLTRSKESNSESSDLYLREGATGLYQANLMNDTEFIRESPTDKQANFQQTFDSSSLSDEAPYRAGGTINLGEDSIFSAATPSMVPTEQHSWFKTSDTNFLPSDGILKFGDGSSLKYLSEADCQRECIKTSGCVAIVHGSTSKTCVLYNSFTQTENSIEVYTHMLNVARTTATPSTEPTATPSMEPTASPSMEPTATPSTEPTATPSTVPTATPSTVPTATPSTVPTAKPSTVPTATPSMGPIAIPSSCDQAVTSGQYTIQPSLTGPTYYVYCDVDTPGGPWMLLWSYSHIANQNNALVKGTIPLSPTTGYSHVLLNSFKDGSGNSVFYAEKTRFYCQTSSHGRKMDFYTSNPVVNQIAFDGNSNSNTPSSWNQGFTPLASHTAYLPAATDGVHKGSTDAFWQFPFYKTGSWNHWGIQSNGYRWLCDDNVATATTTLHQVWVNVVPLQK